MKNITFTMLKPDSVSKGNIGKIIDKIIQDGFEIIAMKYTRLSTEDASKFYSIHSEKPFFKDLILYMTSGPIVAAVIKKENAVEDFRKLIGATNPLEAEKGTIRNLFADSISENAIHGSDSDENAIIESNFHFEKDEIFQ
jgi:nucleoside-diphosphate kinase